MIDYSTAEKPSPKTQLNPAIRTGMRAERPEWHVVANVEEIKVPAGTFESYKINVYDNYTGKLSSEHWYSPKVKWFVKNKTYLASGVREEELLSFKSD